MGDTCGDVKRVSAALWCRPTATASTPPEITDRSRSRGAVPSAWSLLCCYGDVVDAVVRPRAGPGFGALQRRPAAGVGLRGRGSETLPPRRGAVLPAHRGRVCSCRPRRLHRQTAGPVQAAQRRRGRGGSCQLRRQAPRDHPSGAYQRRHSRRRHHRLRGLLPEDCSRSAVVCHSFPRHAEKGKFSNQTKLQPAI